MNKELSGNLYLFADRLPPSFGGMENHALHFIRYFTNNNSFPLKGIISKDYDGKNILLSPNGSKICGCQVSKNVLNILFDNPKKEKLICFFNSGRWIEELAGIRNKLPNAIFIQRTGGNDIIKADLSDLSCSLKQRQTTWANIINKNINIIISNSNFTTNRLIEIGILQNKIVKISGGIDSKACLSALKQRKFLRLNLYNNFYNNKIVLFAGRFVEFKGFEIAVEALKNLNKDIVLCCIGDGELKERYLKFANDELCNRFRYYGKVDADKSLLYISSADILVCPSKSLIKSVHNGKYIHTETMGRVLYEAIGCGTRVVAADVGGVPEIINKSYGSLAPAEDSYSLSLAILNEQNEKRISTSEILSFHKDYSWNTVFENYLSLLKKLLKEH